MADFNFLLCNQGMIAQRQQSASVKEFISDAVQSGKVVTIHEKTISMSGWTGAGYSVIDPDTGAGGYLIEGKGNGGNFSFPDIDTKYFDPGTQAGSFTDGVITGAAVGAIFAMADSALSYMKFTSGKLIATSIVWTYMIGTLTTVVALPILEAGYNTAKDKRCFFSGLFKGFSAGLLSRKAFPGDSSKAFFGLLVASVANAIGLGNEVSSFFDLPPTRSCLGFDVS